MLKFRKYLPLIIVIAYFLLQLPFLTADPDTKADPYSRGAWIDEGLYVLQARNLVNHGYFNVTETDGFVKAPLLNLVNIPVFYVFGAKLIVSRLTTLLIVMLTIFVFLRTPKLFEFGIFLTLFSFLEFHVFHFSHFALAEMTSICMILMSLFFFYISSIKETFSAKRKFIFISALFIFIAYFAKISFLYSAGILPLAMLFMTLRDSFIKRKFIRRDYFLFYWSLFFTIILFGIYFTFMHLIAGDFYYHCLFSQVKDLYSPSLILIAMDTWYIFLREFWVNIFKINIIHFIIILVAGILYLFFTKSQKKSSPILMFAMVWMLFELHKLPMLYLPYRYALSLFFAAGVLLSALYSEWLMKILKPKSFLFAIAIIFGLINFSYTIDSYGRRSYQLKAANEYFSHYDLKEQPVIGPWAASFTWKNKAIAIPVWYKYINWDDPVNTYKPAAIVSEIGELDSDYAYKSQGIDLEAISDSCRVFDVWDYKIGVYWVNQKKINNFF
jgi:hypothetical protein